MNDVGEVQRCTRTGANLRHEILADVIQREYPGFVKSGFLELDPDSSLRRHFSKARRYVLTYYAPDDRPRNVRADGAHHEDVTHLTFPDASSALVVSGEFLKMLRALVVPLGIVAVLITGAPPQCFFTGSLLFAVAATALYSLATPLATPASTESLRRRDAPYELDIAGIHLDNSGSLRKVRRHLLRALMLAPACPQTWLDLALSFAPHRLRLSNARGAGGSPFLGRSRQLPANAY